MSVQRGVFGGQAVIEGVMMRGPRWMAIAVRRPDGEIAVHREEVRSLRSGTRSCASPSCAGWRPWWRP
ncbi:MAG: hypothetical protein A6D92_20710 [Symbiobacterium thermophilum]|uniref:DUF1385 domain-containing protein n=1 Tax=Symbiobacterium thermophilum TaxID=2734 RepID=A0A1Y2T1L9_SYMTR|nr:MAG: hypothetical protein A6D92_20710 [Symbiobacterium thermophilum]